VVDRHVSDGNKAEHSTGQERFVIYRFQNDAGVNDRDAADRAEPDIAVLQTKLLAL
jgi:hypothetical protein